MKEVIKIQEELEKLMDELEKLKKINELTLENAENAKKVISQVDSFVNSATDHIKNVETFQDQQIQTIKGLTKELEDTINSFNMHLNKMSEHLEEFFRNYRQYADLSFNEIKQMFIYNFDLLIKEIKDIGHSLSTKISQKHDELSIYILEQFNEQQIKMKEENQNLKAFIEIQDKKLKRLQTAQIIIGGITILGIFLSILILK